MVRLTKRFDMHFWSVPWPKTCGWWLKEDCKSVGCWHRVFTSWFDSWRRSSWGRRWKLGRWWLGPFEMLGTDFALKKNSPNQVTSSRALQLFYRATSDWIGTWQDHDKHLKVLHPLHMRRHYTNNFSCTSFFFLFFLFTQYAKGLTLRPQFFVYFLGVFKSNFISI